MEKHTGGEEGGSKLINNVTNAYDLIMKRVKVDTRNRCFFLRLFINNYHSKAILFYLITDIMSDEEEEAS